MALHEPVEPRVAVRPLAQHDLGDLGSLGALLHKQPHHRPEELTRALPFALGLDALELCAHLGEDEVDGLVPEVALRREVIVDERLRDTALACNGGRAGALVAVGGERLHRLAENRFTRGGHGSL